jgi:hypothetical protein
MKTAFSQCEVDKSNANKKLIRLEKEFGDAKEELFGCKTTENNMYTTKNTLKNKLDTESAIRKYARDQKIYWCDSRIPQWSCSPCWEVMGKCEEKPMSPPNYVSHIKKNAVAFNDMWKRCEYWMLEYERATKNETEAKIRWNDAVARWKAKVLACKEQQNKFEGISCSRLETTKMTNRDYPVCYDGVLKSWRQSVLGFRKNEIMRFTTWRALQRIKCLLKVIDGKGDILQGINECRKKTYITDFYNLIWWNPPLRKKQYPLKTYACTEEFQLFYKDYKRPMANCQWCDGYKPTPRPTPEPTPEPTPLPTLKPTPKPTPAPYCKAEMFQHGNFKGYKATYGLGTYKYNAFIKRGAKNDDISSMKLKGNTKKCRVTLYEHGSLNGREGTFKRGRYNVRALRKRNVRNDDVSSLKVWLAM